MSAAQEEISLQLGKVTYQISSYYSLVYCGFSVGGGRSLALSWTAGFFQGYHELSVHV